MNYLITNIKDPNYFLKTLCNLGFTNTFKHKIPNNICIRIFNNCAVAQGSYSTYIIKNGLTIFNNIEYIVLTETQFLRKYKMKKLL